MSPTVLIFELNRQWYENITDDPAARVRSIRSAPLVQLCMMNCTVTLRCANEPSILGAPCVCAWMCEEERMWEMKRGEKRGFWTCGSQWFEILLLKYMLIDGSFLFMRCLSICILICIHHLHLLGGNCGN